MRNLFVTLTNKRPLFGGQMTEELFFLTQRNLRLTVGCQLLSDPLLPIMVDVICEAHLIQNCHFTVGNYVMRQCIGIPTGIDPAPFWANLYLYAYENDFM